MDLSTGLTIASMGGGALVYMIGLTIKGAGAISSLRVELAASTAANAEQARKIESLEARLSRAEADLIRNEGHRKSIHAELGATTRLITQRFDAFGDKLSAIAADQTRLAADLRAHMAQEERHARAIEVRLTKVLRRAGLEAALGDEV